eukprot:COSAG02_NODE_1880_length_10551_cov_2.925947_10_plen_139_part_00
MRARDQHVTAIPWSQCTFLLASTASRYAMLTAAAVADGSVHTLPLGVWTCCDRAVPSPQMLTEFFTSEIEGGVSALMSGSMGGHSMAEALGATLGQAVGAAAGAPGGMKFTLDMDSGRGAASGPAGSRAGKTRKKKKR